MTTDNLLGEFLQARRARVTPDRAGIVAYGRRRVPGLRRDELAGLAGVSVAYLTRLEQGVDRHPSPQVLHALATALRLDPDATAHLHALANPSPAAGRPTTAHEEVQDLLDSWSGTPAYARNRFFDVVLANKAAMALAPLYHPGRNLVRDVFLDPAARTVFADWPEIAEQTVAALRASADLRHPRVVALIDELRSTGGFAAWARHDVRPTRNETKRFHHPDAGPLTLRRQTLTVAGAEDLVVIVYRPVPGSASAAALASLL